MQKYLLLASGNQFRFSKAHILNITGLRPTLITNYICDMGRLFIMFKLIVAEYDRLLPQFFPSYFVAYSLSVSSVLKIICNS